MLIKLSGAALIFIACTIWGFLKSDQLKRREQSLVNIKTALTLLEGEIVFSSHHLKYAFEKISKQTQCEDLFSDAADNLESLSADEGWNNAIYNNQKKLCLLPEDCEILKVLSSGLGTSDREQQLKNIRHVSVMLEKVIKEAYENYRTTAKLYRSIGVLGGLFITILLF